MKFLQSIVKENLKTTQTIKHFSSKVNNFKYVHGISSKEEEARLKLQSEGTEEHTWGKINLKALARHNSRLPFLEVGCGVGAQTKTLISKLPEEINIIGIDIDPNQIGLAKKNLSELIPEKLTLKVMDITKETFPENSLSGAYISWVLEHISYSDSVKFLSQLKTSINSGGIIINNEIIMDPDSGMVVKSSDGEVPVNIRKFLNALIDYQKSIGGNANFGSKSNMINCYKDSNITNFIYRPIKMEYPKELHNSILYSKSLFKSVSNGLISSGFLSIENYENALRDLDSSKEIIWNAGQILAFTEEYPHVSELLGIDDDIFQ